MRMPQSRSERIAGVFIYIILSFITLLVLYPLFLYLLLPLVHQKRSCEGKYGSGPRSCHLSDMSGCLPIRSLYEDF